MEKRKLADGLSLMYTLGFDESDLEANARGQLSEGQASRLNGKATEAFLGPVVLFILLAVFGGISIVNTLLGKYPLTGDVCLYGALFIIGVVWFTVAYLKWLDLREAKQSPPESVEGVARGDVVKTANHRLNTACGLGTTASMSRKKLFSPSKMATRTASTTPPAR